MHHVLLSQLNMQRQLKSFISETLWLCTAVNIALFVERSNISTGLTEGILVFNSNGYLRDDWPIMTFDLVCHVVKERKNEAYMHVLVAGCPLKLSRVEPGQYLDGRPPK